MRDRGMTGGEAVTAEAPLFGGEGTVEVLFPHCGADLPRVGMKVQVIGRRVRREGRLRYWGGRPPNQTIPSDQELLHPQPPHLNLTDLYTLPPPPWPQMTLRGESVSHLPHLHKHQQMTILGGLAVELLLHLAHSHLDRQAGPLHHRHKPINPIKTIITVMWMNI